MKKFPMKKKLLLTYQTLKQLRHAHRQVSKSALGKLVRTYAVTAFTVGILSSNVLEAQPFAPPVLNPFGIVSGGSAFATSTAGDLDNDGDLDLLFNHADTAAYSLSLWYYENTGTGSAPAYAAPVIDPFGLTAFSLALVQTPQFADIDNDGDLDLLMGISEQGAGYAIDASLQYFQNTGTAMAPAFAAPLKNPFGMKIPLNATIIAPCLGDMNGDGDLDMVAGTYGGNLYYYNNKGTATLPDYGNPVKNPGNLTAVAQLAFPALADFDNDGDIDLIVGEYYGNFQYFENTGTASASSFAAPVQNPFALIASSIDMSFPAPGDFDNDGDLDMIAGEYSGNIYYYERVTANVNGPIISAIAPQTICVGSTLPINFTAIDAQGDPVTVTVTSSDQGILPDTSVTVAGTAGNYIMTAIPPAGGTSGAVVLTITATDGTNSNVQYVQVMVDAPPAIFFQPFDTEACEFGFAQFGVGSNGSAFQWYKNGTPLPMETSAQIAFFSASAADTGFYYCDISTSCGTPIYSDTVHLTLLPFPTVANQSFSALVCEGEDVPFFVTPTDTIAYYQYQWTVNGSPITNATDPTYLVQGATLADSGSVYECMMYSFCDTTYAVPMNLEVQSAAPPAILSQSSDTLLCVGAVIDLMVISSTSKATYQWYRNGVPVNGSNTPVYIVSATAPADSGDVYRCVVYSLCDSTVSANIVLGVQVCTGIDGEALSQAFQLAPNPASKEVTLFFTGNVAGQMDVRLLNTLGQEVGRKSFRAENGGSFALDLSSLPVGVYSLSLSNGETTAVKKLVIE